MFDQLSDRLQSTLSDVRKRGKLTEDDVDKAYELETELSLKAKTEMLEVVQNILPKHVNCIYIRQAEPLGLGHAVLCAKPVVNAPPAMRKLLSVAILSGAALKHFSRATLMAAQSGSFNRSPLTVCQTPCGRGDGVKARSPRSTRR